MVDLLFLVVECFNLQSVLLNVDLPCFGLNTEGLQCSFLEGVDFGLFKGEYVFELGFDWEGLFFAVGFNDKAVVSFGGLLGRQGEVVGKMK